MNEDYYKTLGISKGASDAEIKSAYRKLALKYHPDKGGGADAEKKFKQISEAYQVLSNPQKRAQYDQFGKSGFSGNRRGDSQGFSGFDFQGASGNDFSGFGFSGGLGDIFEDFFGQAFSTVNAQIEVAPSQAVLGDKFALDIAGEKIEITIPPGTQNGTTFVLRGKGRTYKNNGRGDLNITVKIKMPTRLTTEQRELWKKLQQSEKKKSWWKF